jgi:hypothetical protein
MPDKSLDLTAFLLNQTSAHLGGVEQLGKSGGGLGSSLSFPSIEPSTPKRRSRKNRRKEGERSKDSSDCSERSGKKAQRDETFFPPSPENSKSRKVAVRNRSPTKKEKGKSLRQKAEEAIEREETAREKRKKAKELKRARGGSNGGGERSSRGGSVGSGVDGRPSTKDGFDHYFEKQERQKKKEVARKAELHAKKERQERLYAGALIRTS